MTGTRSWASWGCPLDLLSLCILVEWNWPCSISFPVDVQCLQVGPRTMQILPVHSFWYQKAIWSNIPAQMSSWTRVECFHWELVYNWTSLYIGALLCIVHKYLSTDQFLLALLGKNEGEQCFSWRKMHLQICFRNGWTKSDLVFESFQQPKLQTDDRSI